MKNLAEKEIERMEKIIDKIKILKKDNGLFDMAKRYFLDSKYFFDHKKYVQAFEAAVIVWAYIDSGLRLKLFGIPKKYKECFTV